MALCPVCGGEISARARYCPHCGARQQDLQPSPEQLKLPGVGSGFPLLAAQTAGGGAIFPAAPAEQASGRPLSVKQVAITVGIVMLFLLGFIYLVGNRSLTDTGGAGQPIVGVMNEPITVGDTVLGVAFVQSPERIDNKTAQNGRFLAVGVVVGNHGGQAFTLDQESFGLSDGKNDGAYQPMLAAYGTLEELRAGQYHQRIALPPGEALAAVVLFDLSQDDTKPRLLVRDLTHPSKRFTGAVDLTKEAPSPDAGGSAQDGVRPLEFPLRWF